MARTARVTACEREREDLVRTLPCPVDGCGAGPGEACPTPVWVEAAHRHRWAYAHTGRYERAAAALLVPPLAGAR